MLKSSNPKFAAAVKPDHFSGRRELVVTHNGAQAVGVSVNEPNEALIMANALIAAYQEWASDPSKPW